MFLLESYDIHTWIEITNISTAQTATIKTEDDGTPFPLLDDTGTTVASIDIQPLHTMRFYKTGTQWRKMKID